MRVPAGHARHPEGLAHSLSSQPPSFSSSQLPPSRQSLSTLLTVGGTVTTYLRHLFTAIAAALLLAAACTETVPPEFLGSAIVEAQVYQVGTTVQGQLVAVHFDEGQRADSGALMAVVDTVPLMLTLDELSAGRSELGQQIAARRAEVEAAKSEVRGLKREVERMRTLVEKGSAPAQKRDQLETSYETAQFKLKAAKAAMAGLVSHRKTVDAKEAQLREQLSRCYVRAPASGVVLTRYRSVGEIAGPAAPLFEIGSYDSVWADFFASQPLVGTLTLGQQVRLRVDTGPKAEAVFVEAALTWISDEAEFSPKNIQTRDARNELVFRVRARAANPDRILKRGLPVEVWL